MAMIYVKTREGRRAIYEGRMIPSDKFVPVPDTPFIRRLISHHEDVEVQGDLPPAPSRRLVRSPPQYMQPPTTAPTESVAPLDPATE